MPLTFERATYEDAVALVQVQVAAFNHDSVLYPDVPPGGPPGYDSVEVLQNRIAQHPCYCMRYDDEIVGLITVFDHGPDNMHLDVIAIHPSYHNRGFGTQAMAFFEQTHPATRYTLDTPSWAVRNHHFYEKLGYRKVGEIPEYDITLFSYEKRTHP